MMTTQQKERARRLMEEEKVMIELEIMNKKERRQTDKDHCGSQLWKMR